MFVQGTQSQIKHDIYLAWLYQWRIAVVIMWHSEPASFYGKAEWT